MGSPENDSNTTVQQLRDLVGQFVQEREWKKFHDLKNLSMALTIEAAELMELTQWLTSSEIQHPGAVDRNAVSEELADVACYVLAIANALEIDLSAAIGQKMERNRRKYPVGTARTAQGLPTIYEDQPADS